MQIQILHILNICMYIKLTKCNNNNLLKIVLYVKKMNIYYMAFIKYFYSCFIFTLKKNTDFIVCNRT